MPFWKKGVHSSRLVTRALVVLGVLALVLGTQVDRAVKTAYDAEWTTAGERLPTETWKWLLVGSGPVAIFLLLAAACVWHLRERTAALASPAPDVTVTPFALGGLALALSLVGAGFRWAAVVGHGSDKLTLATVFDLAALATVSAYALVIGNLVYLGSGGISRVLRGVFRRQRTSIAIVAALAIALLFLGDTSGQSVDSIRSWSPYVAGTHEPLSGAGAARLLLGLAATLMFALGLYESGVLLVRSRWSSTTPVRSHLVVSAILVTAAGALVFFPAIPIGPGILIAGLILVVLLLLELPNVTRSAPSRADSEAHRPTRAEANTSEWIAITPMLALAATSVTAAVEAALSSGWGDGNAALTLIPAVVLGALAILLTGRRPNDPLRLRGRRWILATLAVAAVTIASFALALWAGRASEWILAGYGAAWLAVLAGYAVWLFHLGDEPSAALVADEPDEEVAVVATTAAPEGWGARFGAYRGRVRVYVGESSVPFVLGPVAVGGGLAVFLAVHVKPLPAGRLLGVFTLAFVALAFALPFLHLAVRATLRLRPPKLLWWFGMNQVPVLTLLALWWIAVGITQTQWGKTETLHDARLVDRKAAGDTGGPARAGASDLEQYFKEWVAAQGDMRGTDADGPVPLVLVAAHGGGIRAAYWTVLALDCIVGYSPGGVREADLDSSDVAVKTRLRARACAARRRNDDRQAVAAKRIFMASGVSGGAVGLYAYARQLIDRGTLGQPAPGHQDWIDRHLAYDFAAPAIGWALFHDVPNRLFGLHPGTGGHCGAKVFGVCLEQDRAAVLEDTFDSRWDVPASALAQLRRTYDLRFAPDTKTSRRARMVPLLAMNSTLTGGKARAVISAADLGSWPRADAESPGTGDDRLPLAGTVEVRDALCETQDMRLSTAALLAARFPYVTPSGRVPGRCGYDGKLKDADTPPAVYCAHKRPSKAQNCAGNYVDGGYTDNSGLFTLVSIWPSLRALIVQHNLYAKRSGLRKIAPLIVELDNHYQKSRQPAVPSGGTAAETLVPPLTAFGGRSAIETFARAAAYRILPTSCTVTISPALHPGLIAPLGWELSEAARMDLRAGLTNPHPADTNGVAVKNLLTVQFRLAAAKHPKHVIGEPLKVCLPPEPCPPTAAASKPPADPSPDEVARSEACLKREGAALALASSLPGFR